METRKFFLALGSCFLAVLIWAQASWASPAEEAARLIPIQHNGRIKSLDVFARETLRYISFKDHLDKKSNS